MRLAKTPTLNRKIKPSAEVLISSHQNPWQKLGVFCEPIIKKFWPEIKFVFLVFTIWRVGLFVVGLLSFRLLTFSASFPYIDQLLIGSGHPQWFWHWGNFDGAHYLEIALFGYRGPGLQVYFPLYPLMIRALAALIGNYFLAGFLISNISIFFAAILFFLLVKRDFNKKVARWSTIFLFAFPTSFFFGSIYTESIFFLLLMLAFYTKGIVSFASSVLAGATRIIGAFIFPFFGVIGMTLYSLFLWLTFNNPIYFLTAQSAFKNARSDSLTTIVTPFQVVFRYLKIFLTVDPHQVAFQVSVLEFLSFFLVIIVLLFLTFKKKIPAKYLVFSWLAAILPSLSGTLSSMPRYVLPIFPIYLFFAMVKDTRVKLVILGFFIVLLAILTTYFVRGYFIA